jgi:methylated-DNA-[protein]-cysteine S-methyltransferase
MRQRLTHASYATPFGELHVFASGDGVVRASGFRSIGDIAAQLTPPWSSLEFKDGKLPVVTSAVERWLLGDGDALASVPVEQDGGEFFQKVWKTLRGLPAGEPVSYAELAETAGNPRAMRAVGTACARNAVAPFVPCHRVINSGGSLGSYGYGGAATKAGMLALETGASADAIEAIMATAHPDSTAPTKAFKPAQPLQGVWRK